MWELERQCNLQGLIWKYILGKPCHYLCSSCHKSLITSETYEDVDCNKVQMKWQIKYNFLLKYNPLLQLNIKQWNGKQVNQNQWKV